MLVAVERGVKQALEAWDNLRLAAWEQFVQDCTFIIVMIFMLSVCQRTYPDISSQLSSPAAKADDRENGLQCLRVFFAVLKCGQGWHGLTTWEVEWFSQINTNQTFDGVFQYHPVVSVLKWGQSAHLHIHDISRPSMLALCWPVNRSGRTPRHHGLLAVQHILGALRPRPDAWSILELCFCTGLQYTFSIDFPCYCSKKSLPAKTWLWFEQLVLCIWLYLQEQRISDIFRHVGCCSAMPSFCFAHFCIFLHHLNAYQMTCRVYTVSMLVDLRREITPGLWPEFRTSSRRE